MEFAFQHVCFVWLQVDVFGTFHVAWNPIGFQVWCLDQSPFHCNWMTPAIKSNHLLTQLHTNKLYSICYKMYKAIFRLCMKSVNSQEKKNNDVQLNKNTCIMPWYDYSRWKNSAEVCTFRQQHWWHYTDVEFIELFCWNLRNLWERSCKENFKCFNWDFDMPKDEKICILKHGWLVKFNLKKSEFGRNLVY